MKKINLQLSERDADRLLHELAKAPIKSTEFAGVIKCLQCEIKKAARKDLEYKALYLIDLNEDDVYKLFIDNRNGLCLCMDENGELFISDVDPQDINDQEYLVPDLLETAYSFGPIGYDCGHHYIDFSKAYGGIEMPYLNTEMLQQLAALFELLDQFEIAGTPQ